MSDKDVEQIDQRHHPLAPWWAELGTRGAVGLIVLGGLAAAWAVVAPAVGLDRVPFAPDNPATGLYQAGSVIAIGAVILVSGFLNRRREGRTQEK